MDGRSETAIVARVADAIERVGGIVGVVLGGSRARRTADPSSDYDIGAYYSPESLDLAALAEAAKTLDDDSRDNLVAPPGAWGKWVNGGGWLVVEGAPVDILLRDIGRVEQSVADCLAGKVEAHYQTGHPHAFVNTMYAGELSIARILRDRTGRLEELRKKTRPYPRNLKEGIVAQFGFEAGFSLLLAKKALGKDDGYYLAAHIVRSLSCLNQVLFAVNGEYCVNEKKAAPMIDGFPLKPRDYRRRVGTIVARCGVDDGEACAVLETLVDETRCLENFPPVYKES